MDEEKRPSDDDDDQENESDQNEDTPPAPESEDGDHPQLNELERIEIERILAECEANIRNLIRRKFPGLGNHDQEDVIQEVALALGENIAKSNGTLWQERDIRYTVSIAWKKACDKLRGKSRELAKRKVKQDLLTSQFSLWDGFTLAERAEFSAIMAESARTLTPFQLWLWENYVEHYPKSRRGNYLADKTGLPFSSKEMKRWIGEIRERFVTDLRSKGYDLDRDE